MRTNTFPFRLTAALVAFAMFAAPLVPTAAFAQTESPVVDPPGRVGRVARLSGTVSFHGAEQTQWESATLNYPVTSGSAFWTEPRSGAELDIAGGRVVLEQNTHFDIDQLTDHSVTATVAQGSIYIALRGLLPGDTMQVRTPRGTVTLAQDGQYEVAAGDTERPTTVSVIGGQAQIAGDNVSLLVSSNQSARITGPGPFEGRVGPLAASPFLTGQTAPVRPMPSGDYAPPAVVQQMTGGESLADTGRWERNTEYGQVWYPPVSQGWVPYRHGRWAFVAPWGWTWIDEAPWGFAPFHYGRWMQIGPSWAWSPVVQGYAPEYGYRPFYSPALVGFIGLGIGVAIGASLGRSVGWYPLGPSEPYYPPYRTSPAYIRNVNITNVTNVTNITNITHNTVPPAAAVNRGATTVIPASAMTNSQPVAARVQPVPASALAQIQPVRAPAVQPTTATTGVTPAVARQMNLAQPTPGTVAPRPVAPGPAVQPVATGGAVPLRPSTAPVPGGGASAPGAPAPQPPRPTPQAGALPPISGQGGAAPSLAPSGTQRQPAAAPLTPASPSASGAPGPAIQPRSVALPGAAAPLPQLRPANPASPPTQGGAPGAAPSATPNIARPGIPNPSPAPGGTPGIAAQPRAPAIPASPQIANPAPRVAPAQPSAPAPQVQRAAPAPQQQYTPPPVQRAAPQPQYTPPPVQRAAPQPQYSPPPVQHAAPPVQHYSPPPVQHAAPAPAPAPRQAPPPAQKSCPPGRPTC